MRKILKDTCILAALMIITVFGISIRWAGVTDEIKLVILLFGLAFTISVMNYYIDEYSTLSIWMNYIVKFCVISVTVMLFGFIAGWFDSSNFWMSFIYVGTVMILGYFIDGIRIKRDIEYINFQINNNSEK